MCVLCLCMCAYCQFIAAERKVIELARSMKGNKEKPKKKRSKDQIIWGCKKVYKTLRTLDEPRMFLVAGNIECDGKRIAYDQLCKEDRARLNIPSAFRRQVQAAAYLLFVLRLLACAYFVRFIPSPYPLPSVAHAPFAPPLCCSCSRSLSLAWRTIPM